MNNRVITSHFKFNCSKFITEDRPARLTLLRFLLTLRPVGHEQSLFGFSLLDELLANYRETLTGSSRCYGNSMLHRFKHRMMVAMFALEKFLMVEFFDVELSSF